MKNKIVSIFLFSLFISIAFVFFSVTTLSFTAPLFMAKNFERWGMSSFAYGCYDRAYKASEKIDQQYVMFEKAVNYGYNKHVLYYSERIIANADFEAFCIVTNTTNNEKAEKFCTENSIIGNSKIKLLLSVSNEENYIENQYVKALVKAGKINQALSFAMADVKEEISRSNVSYDVTFLLLNVVNAGEKLSISDTQQVTLLYDKLSSYVDALVLDGSGKITNFKDMLIAQRLCEIASTLEKIYLNNGETANAENMKLAFENYKEMIYG